jgi:hypothetical protein
MEDCRASSWAVGDDSEHAYKRHIDVKYANSAKCTLDKTIVVVVVAAAGTTTTMAVFLDLNQKGQSVQHLLWIMLHSQELSLQLLGRPP